MRKSTWFATLFFTALSLTSLAQNSKVEIDNGMKIDNLKRDDYVITGTIQGTSTSSRIWILFIPIGGSNKTHREQKAYKQALASCGCDGLIQPVYDEKRFVIPLIVINFSHRKTTVTGKGYRIKTDADKTVPIQQTSDIPNNTTNPPQTITGFSVGDAIYFTFKGERTEGRILSLHPNYATIQFVKKSGKVSIIKRLDLDQISKNK